MTEINLPIMYLREVVLLPFNDIRLEFNNDIDKNILKLAERNYDNHLLLVNLKDPLEESPTINELPKIGIVSKIKSKIDLPNGISRVVLTGISRVNILNYIETTEYISAFTSSVSSAFLVLTPFSVKLTVKFSYTLVSLSDGISLTRMSYLV